MTAEQWKAQLLFNDDGPILLVRGENVADVAETAHGFAESDDLVIRADLTQVKVEHIRAVPCVEGGHEFDTGYCYGDFKCHYVPGPSGPGAFLGAFVDVRPKTYAEIQGGVS